MALTAASWMLTGVWKSGWPIQNEMMSLPCRMQIVHFREDDEGVLGAEFARSAADVCHVDSSDRMGGQVPLETCPRDFLCAGYRADLAGLIARCGKIGQFRTSVQPGRR